MAANSAPRPGSTDPLAPPPALKPPVELSTLTHREMRTDDFWRVIPAWRDIDRETFLDHRWQSKHTITNPRKLLDAVQELAPSGFVEDAVDGFRRAPMAVRITPYLLSLIDWSNPVTDPLRIQFLPIGSSLLADHPKVGLDSLAEQADAPVPGLTHRYGDKALFLPLDTCPVYCRFCTRSYAIGINTENVEKISLKANRTRWDAAYQYVASRPELEDIVVSGGDAYNLRPDWLREIGRTLLDMPNIRRVRIASKGPAVMPQKILTDDDWFRALVEVVDYGRERFKEVALHTHFGNANEITGITEQAMCRLFGAGVTVRNQTVLQRGVNDTNATMGRLIKTLGHLNVHPYYVYVHDLVQGVEDLRTTLQTGLDIEKYVRGLTAGFNTPTFVVDAPGGGGKRNAHSAETYDRTTGISVYTAPSVKPGQHFLYFDPIDLLPEEGRRRWADPAEHDNMIREALDQARCEP